MHAWPAPDVPALPGEGLPLRLHDTATGEVRPTAPGPEARIYVCGITPYDATHMGHAATYVAFDLVQRVWLDAGHSVHYVQNITDVDDPLLARALETGDDWESLADRETQLFREDMTALSVLPPRHYIGAVESIPSVIDYIAKLQAAGAVYPVDGDLYFRVHADERFGSVANLSAEDMLTVFAERGGDPERLGKEHPLDCLLWQLERPGEPSWDSPFGRGRPGWHIECTAIALDHLDSPLDVLGGLIERGPAGDDEFFEQFVGRRQLGGQLVGLLLQRFVLEGRDLLLHVGRAKHVGGQPTLSHQLQERGDAVGVAGQGFRHGRLGAGRHFLERFVQCILQFLRLQ